ncbi:MAG: hydrogenase maturation nickel metallochaperone HypA [Aigarchaeota archaeon]|nr:hydrogenase maturation nickel metallochaperone HypA [Aigarchaeota archaeon]
MGKLGVAALAMGAAWWILLILLRMATELPFLLLGVFTILFVYLWVTTPKSRETGYLTVEEIKVTILCSKCGTAYDESNENCPSCGSPP